MECYRTNLFVISLVICISAGLALDCYTCWTKDNNDCEPETLPQMTSLLRTCNKKQNVCKKIVTKAYRVIKRGNNANYQIISNLTSRLCGQADWRGCFEMRGASSVTIQCACDENGCNSAPTIRSSSSITVFTSATLCVLAALRYYR